VISRELMTMMVTKHDITTAVPPQYHRE